MFTANDHYDDKMFTANDHYDHPTILPSLTPYLPSMPRPKGPFPLIFPIFIEYFSIENFLRNFHHTNDSSEVSSEIATIEIELNMETSLKEGVLETVYLDNPIVGSNLDLNSPNSAITGIHSFSSLKMVLLHSWHFRSWKH